MIMAAWSCPACSYKNASDALECELCDCLSPLVQQDLHTTSKLPSELTVQTEKCAVVVQHEQVTNEILARLSGSVPAAEFLANFCTVARVRARRSYTASHPNRAAQESESPLAMGDILVRTKSTDSELSQNTIVTTNMDRESAIKARGTRLTQRLEDCGLQMVQMKDDGNCLFRAAACQLLGDAELHPVVRQRVVENMKERQSEFRVFFESPTEFEEYMQAMAADKTWGDELALSAIADCFSAVAHVVTSNRERWYSVYLPKQNVDFANQKEIFLAYIFPVHYNSIALAPSGELEEEIVVEF